MTREPWRDEARKALVVSCCHDRDCSNDRWLRLAIDALDEKDAEIERLQDIIANAESAALAGAIEAARRGCDLEAPHA